MGLFRHLGTRVQARRRSLAGLAAHAAGSTLAMLGAALIPLTAMIGSGVDLSRTYIAQQRLQQACDAASLAGRRAMENDVFNSTVSTEALKFFNFNFPQGKYGTTSFTPVVSRPESGVIRVQANTTVPTAVMKIFGFDQLPISVDCKSSLNFVNTDIVLVLDTTGSMLCATTESSCSNSGEKSSSKIKALRAAVLSLYDELSSTQTQLAAAGMRLRYGIVPYASTVNVGRLLWDENNAYIRNPANYQKRSCSGPGYLASCSYAPTSVNHGNGWLTGTSSNSWAGCIEERQTSSAITGSTTTIPAAAFDLNIDLVPNSTATRWPPYDPQFASEAGHQVACPTGAVRLQAWTRSAMDTYLNTLRADGGTYHDIGMIWGARLISSAGVFADSPDRFNGMPVNKFIIFMTDGLLDTGPAIYSAYGIEQYDERVTGGSLSTQDERHRQRFNLMCSAVKNRGVSIWVVAFASSLDANLTNCATTASQAATVSNQDALNAKFVEIGKNIGSLRLTK